MSFYNTHYNANYTLKNIPKTSNYDELCYILNHGLEYGLYRKLPGHNCGTKAQILLAQWGYLPLIGRYLEALIDRPSYAGVNKGKYLQISSFNKDKNIGNGYSEDNNYWGWELKDFNTKWKLIPEEYKIKQSENLNYEIY